MSQFDNDYELKHNNHFRTRAVGNLYLGPMQRDGYDNRVIQLTTTTIDFSSVGDADRFMDRMRKKYAGSDALSRARLLKTISKDDDK